MVLTDRAHINALLTDLADSGMVLRAEAVELGMIATARVKAIKDHYFLVETNVLADEIISVPLSSWRLIVELEGASFCLTTVSLARVETKVFALLIPDEIVSGSGRRHYRVMTTGSETFQVSLQSSDTSDQAEIVDASFSGLQVRLQKPLESNLAQGSKILLTGRQRGIIFKEEASVVWRNKDSVGIVLSESAGSSPIEDRPWSHVVRRLAYDQFMKHLRPVA